MKRASRCWRYRQPPARRTGGPGQRMVIKATEQRRTMPNSRKSNATEERKPATGVDLQKVEAGVRLILEGIGEDPNRPGLEGTPRRVALMYEEICAGLHQDPRELIHVIPAETHDEMVIVKDIP